VKIPQNEASGDMATEHLDVSRCPRCALAHRYKLAVERTLILKLMTMADMTERPRQVRVTRLVHMSHEE